MRILVLIKQVPEPAAIRFAGQLNRIERSGVSSIANPLDLVALDVALGLAAESAGEVVVATMGPPEARSVLDAAVQRGADRGVHLVDLAFAGADSLATARALAALVAREQPDLVLCGRSTLDGATAQVGPQLAELAGLHVATEAVEVRLHGDVAEIVRETRAGREQIAVELPAVVTVDGGSGIGATPARLVGSIDVGAVSSLDAQALGGDPAGYGIRGSATYVRRIDSLERTPCAERVRDPREGLSRLEDLTRRPAPGEHSGPREARAEAGPEEIWVVVETDGNSFSPVSLEAVACAETVAGRLRARVVAVLLGSAAPGAPDALAAAGVRHVLHGRSPDLRHYSPEAFVAALSRLLEHRRPLAVLGGWTTAGREWLPRVAARRALGMTGDVVGLDVEERPGNAEILDLIWLKPAWTGGALARVAARTTPSFGTLRPGVFASLPGLASGVPTTEVVELGALGSRARRGPTPPARGGRALVEDIDDAAVVVLVGDTLSSDELDGAALLAKRLGGVLGGTRAAVRAGAVSPVLEVSLLKRCVGPGLVVALGIEDPADLIPVSTARVIATVGTASPVHDQSDLAIVCPVSDLTGLLA